MEFKGTKGKWRYVKPTQQFDATTIAENGKIIGYCAKNSAEDRANELLRSKAPEMLEKLLECIHILSDVPLGKEMEQWMQDAERLIKEATTI